MADSKICLERMYDELYIVISTMNKLWASSCTDYDDKLQLCILSLIRFKFIWRYRDRPYVDYLKDDLNEMEQLYYLLFNKERHHEFRRSFFRKSYSNISVILDPRNPLPFYVTPNSEYNNRDPHHLLLWADPADASRAQIRTCKFWNYCIELKIFETILRMIPDAIMIKLNYINDKMFQSLGNHCEIYLFMLLARLKLPSQYIMNRLQDECLEYIIPKLFDEKKIYYETYHHPTLLSMIVNYLCTNIIHNENVSIDIKRLNHIHLETSDIQNASSLLYLSNIIMSRYYGANSKHILLNSIIPTINYSPDQYHECIDDNDPIQIETEIQTTDNGGYYFEIGKTYSQYSKYIILKEYWNKMSSKIVVDLWPGLDADVYIQIRNNKTILWSNDIRKLNYLINCSITWNMMNIKSNPRLGSYLLKITHHIEQMIKYHDSAIISFLRHFMTCNNSNMKIPNRSDSDNDKVKILDIILKKIISFGPKYIWECFRAPYNQSKSWGALISNKIDVSHLKTKSSTLYSALYTFLTIMSNDDKSSISITENGVLLLYQIYDRNVLWFDMNMPALGELIQMIYQNIKHDGLKDGKFNLSLLKDYHYIKQSVFVIYNVCILDDTLISNDETIRLFVSLIPDINIKISSRHTGLKMQMVKTIPQECHHHNTAVSYFFACMFYITMYGTKIDIYTKTKSTFIEYNELSQYNTYRGSIIYDHMRFELPRISFGKFIDENVTKYVFIPNVDSSSSTLNTINGLDDIFWLSILDAEKITKRTLNISVEENPDIIHHVNDDNDDHLLNNIFENISRRINIKN